MNVTANNKRASAWLAFCALFITVSFAASLHHAEHDATSTQGKVCSVCVSATQLGAALPGNATALSLDAPHPDYESFSHEDFATRHAVAARQRGPPPHLSS